MGAPNPDVVGLVNLLALRHWLPANTPNLSSVIAAVTAQLTELGGVITQPVIDFATIQIDQLYAAQVQVTPGGSLVVPSITSPSIVTSSIDTPTAGQTLALGPTNAAQVLIPANNISARYQTSTAQSIPGSGAETVVNYNIKQWDTKNIVTTGASWRFTPPVAGKYRVSTSNEVTTTTNSKVAMVFKNGVLYALIGGSSTLFTTAGTTLVDLVVGDFADLRIHNDDSTAALSGVATNNWIAIDYYGP